MFPGYRFFNNQEILDLLNNASLDGENYIINQANEHIDYDDYDDYGHLSMGFQKYLLRNM